jgi:hypothetical protein
VNRAARASWLLGLLGILAVPDLASTKRQCRSDVASTFYAPLPVLTGSADTMTPARHYEQMKAAQPASAPELNLIVILAGLTPLTCGLPDRTVLGMRLGLDAEATADARRQVIEFLAAHGLISDPARR